MSKSSSFLSKKSWHVTTIKNQKRVWELEQEKEAEQKKVEQWKREKEEQDEIRNLKNLAQGSKSERLDWMYEGGYSSLTKEEKKIETVDDYLNATGKKLEDLKGNDQNINKSLPGALFNNGNNNQSSSNSVQDQKTRLREDPLQMILQKQKESIERAKSSKSIQSKLSSSSKDKDKDKDKTEEKILKKLKKKEKKEKKEKEKEMKKEKKDNSDQKDLYVESKRDLSPKNSHRDDRNGRDYDRDDRRDDYRDRSYRRDDNYRYRDDRNRRDYRDDRRDDYYRDKDHYQHHRDDRRDDYYRDRDHYQYNRDTTRVDKSDDFYRDRDHYDRRTPDKKRYRDDDIKEKDTLEKQLESMKNAAKDVESDRLKRIKMDSEREEKDQSQSPKSLENRLGSKNFLDTINKDVYSDNVSLEDRVKRNKFYLESSKRDD
ncbi:hypothetical protein DLAC_08547 [Tieghemostelium lacteum]|uniref:CBF1-interacting co-repressor CIR N-terminal domain-containing protein n=1 Tax=Tieghemostelium lacteum TaxID=361077 RepID=A0A151Z7R2_TIELA|nr:hypothetical protein DLAC_08547 [Tieghemostelium lacteum]|eukprot:KYQ89977.1 hypothetical protein DLAC_08547 [Tieghemostelium lacteum]